MTILQKDDAFTGKRTKFDREHNEVRCVATSSHPELEKGERLVIDWSFSFEGVTDVEVFELAAELLLIQARPSFKASKMNQDVQTFSVREMIDASRKKADPVKKIVKFAKDSSDAEKLEMIAQLQASMSN